MLQLHAPGIRKQAIGGNQLTAKKFQCFCTTKLCAGPVLVEHPQSIELAKEVRRHVVESAYKRDRVLREASR
jgi:hypothetical protein